MEIALSYISWTLYWSGTYFIVEEQTLITLCYLSSIKNGANPTILFGAMLQTLIFCLQFLKCFTLFKFITSIHESDMIQEQVLMLVEKNWWLYHTFLGSYIYKNNILAEKDIWKQPYHTFLESYINQRQNQM